MVRNMQSAQIIKQSLNGCCYFTCQQCLFTTLDENEIKGHLDEKIVPDNCHSKLGLRCFGCTNIFFSKYSLLTHAIYDHQMKESYAIILINHLTSQSQSPPSSEPKTEVNTEPLKKPSDNEKPNEIRILSDIRLPSANKLQSLCKVITKAPSNNVRLDISGPLEDEIINDLNNPLNLPASDDEHEDQTEINCKKNKIKRKSVKKKDGKSLSFKCDLDNCNVRLLAKENIAYHKKCHNVSAKGDSDTFCCPECLEFFSNQWNKMASHLWRLHLVDMELHTCSLCNYKTPSLSKLINQHQGIHGNERPFVCEYCGKGFKTSKQLRTHKVCHKLSDNTSFACDKCQRIFKTCRLLKLHHNSVHKECKPFSCHFCNYSASTRSGLKLHLRRHTGEKPFSCDQCAYSTGDHNSIRRHKLRHLGLKPYKCAHCSYACIQSSTYKVHLKNKHPGLDHGLMFSCDYCSYRSLNEANLQTHMAKHTEPSNKS